MQNHKLLKIFIPRKFRKYFYSGDLKNAGKLEKIFRKVVAYDQTNQLKKINNTGGIIFSGRS